MRTLARVGKAVTWVVLTAAVVATVGGHALTRPLDPGDALRLWGAAATSRCYTMSEGEVT